MRFFVLPIFDGVIMDGHPIFWVVDAPRFKYWMPIHYDTIEDRQNKKSHLLCSFLVRIVSFLHFISRIYLSKILLHHFIGFIWIITPLLKTNVSFQETEIIAWHSSRTWIPFAYKCVTRYAVFTHIKHANTLRNCWTCYPSWSSNGWAEFWPEPMKFLVDMLYHAHKLRMCDHVHHIDSFIFSVGKLVLLLILNCTSKPDYD